MQIPAQDSLSVGVTEAIQRGDVARLEQLLQEHPGLATARIDDGRGCQRSLLHIVADWPGHFPNGAACVAVIAAAGADPNAPFIGPHCETPLHCAASSDDVAVLDAGVRCGGLRAVARSRPRRTAATPISSTGCAAAARRWPSEHQAGSGA